MKNKKKIIGTVVFLAIGIVMFVHISYLLRPLYEDFWRDRVTGFYAEEENSIDVLGIGSSSLYRYLDNPYLWENYGLTSYNLSTPGQSELFIDTLLDEALKTQSPKLLVIETRKFTMTQEKNSNSRRFPLVHDNMKFSWNRTKAIYKAYDTWQERLDAYFDIIAYHDTWEELSYDNIKYMDNEESHELKGWSNSAKIERLEAPVIDESDETLPISEFSEETLIQLMERCKTENIQVLFIATPYQLSEDAQKKNRYIGNLIEEYGFNYLDCNLYMDEIGLDFETDFYNKKHTNLLGAEKVTKFIGDYIQDNYDLDIKHSEEVTEDWNQMLELYKADVTETKAMMKETIAETE